MIKVRFEDVPTTKWSAEFGPFEFVQLTYNELRVALTGKDAHEFAVFRNGYWTINDDPKMHAYTDVVIFSCDPVVINNPIAPVTINNQFS